ncbi:hypothetical protein BH09MYX1_BH09MYX1_01960 [soil metagenome]
MLRQFSVIALALALTLGIASQGCGSVVTVESPACVDGSQMCSEKCAAVSSDPQNCGACGVHCAAQQVCDRGVCASECRGGSSACGGGCMNLQTDRANCGTCGTTCASGQVCSAGACALSCQAGLATCNAGVPYCANLETDGANCGKCGVACPLGSSCIAAACRRCGPALQLPGLPQTSVATKPRRPRIADFDGDGIADVAFLSDAAAVGIALGKGNGTFGLPTLYAVTNYPLDLVVADLDRDGRLDVGVTNDTIVEVLWGNGDGTVAKAALAQDAVVATVPGSRSILAENLDGKGALELVLADATGVTILQKSAYESRFPYVTHIDIAEAKNVTAADVNGDGSSDLLVPSELANGVVSVLLNDGNGAFGAAIPISVGAFPRRVIARKVDGDATTDLVVAWGDSLDVMLGAGNGQFTFSSTLKFPYPLMTIDVGTADIEGDGLVDIVATGFGLGPVGFANGKGNGAFDAPVALLGAPYASGLDLGDLNGDGSPDLVYTSFGIGALVNDGKGAFPQPVKFDGTPPATVRARDMNADGHVDLVTPDRVYLGDGKGAFSALAGGAFHSWSVTVADVDGDGKLDLIGPAYSTGVDVGSGDGKGNVVVVVNLPLSFAPIGVAVADVTGDGKLDIIAQQQNYYVRDLAVLRGDGKGAFASAVMTPAVGPAGLDAVADFDGDGRADVLVGGNGTKLYEGRPDGTFAVSDVSVIDVPDAAADLDGDGKLDLVSIRGGNNGMSVAHGNGDGTFGPATFMYPGYYAPWGTVGDVDGDGKLDLVTGVWATYEVAIMLGNGKGGFGAPLIYATDVDPTVQYQANPVAIADFDGDGRRDIVAGRSILMNRGTVACGFAR